MKPIADQIRDLRKAEALSELYQPRRAAALLDGRQPALRKFAADFIGRQAPLLYLEFGVAFGASITNIKDLFTHPDSVFVGFDSFTGLPEPWLMHDRGAFSNNGMPPVLNDPRVRFVKGWFQNTLPDYVTGIERDLRPNVLIHYDADLYSSTLFVLTMLWRHIPRYYFMMDDFVQDDVIALRDFAVAYPVEIEFFAQTVGGNNNPDQVFGRMTRVELSIDADR